eukprot:TRINITY_DN32803_c2_g2_i1.p2 TRINITY_DN32803_c2_g2~~TRINITY_DN32803_c2_g2_i1.p2  ORF type:complete len:141 (+),score=0.33 TRINITY_DN32803_c2_g2_i1:652-1074(+)
MFINVNFQSLIYVGLKNGDNFQRVSFQNLFWQFVVVCLSVNFADHGILVILSLQLWCYRNQLLEIKMYDFLIQTLLCVWFFFKVQRPFFILFFELISYKDLIFVLMCIEIQNILEFLIFFWIQGLWLWWVVVCLCWMNFG